MKITTIGTVLLAVCLAQGAFGEEEGPAGFQFILGPRLGVATSFDSKAEFSESVSKMYGGGDYNPYFTIFGFNLEQRILLGQTRSHFAFQEVVTVNGLEQSVALPTLAGLIGYRDASGLEFGAGPSVSLNGIAVVAALGYTISYQGVYAPVDLSVTLPGPNSKLAVAVTTGFNFVTSSMK